MISKKFYKDFLDKFSFLKMSPKDIESVKSSYELFSLVFQSDEEFKNAFMVWISEHDTFPTHIDLKKSSQPDIKQLSVNEVFYSHDQSEEARNIERWCRENFDCKEPSASSYEYRMRTHEDAARWKQNKVMALQSFYKRVRNKEIKYQEIALNDDSLKIDHSADNFKGLIEGIGK